MPSFSRIDPVTQKLFKVKKPYYFRLVYKPQEMGIRFWVLLILSQQTIYRCVRPWTIGMYAEFQPDRPRDSKVIQGQETLLFSGSI